MSYSLKILCPVFDLRISIFLQYTVDQIRIKNLVILFRYLPIAVVVTVYNTVTNGLYIGYQCTPINLINFNLSLILGQGVR